MSDVTPDPIAPKGLLQSRTIVFNGIVAILTIGYAVAQVVSQNPTGLDPRIISVAGIIVAIGNLYFRLGTTQPIAGTGAADRVEAAKQTIALNAAVHVAGPIIPSVSTTSTVVPPPAA